jgi:hypothetical protein
VNFCGIGNELSFEGRSSEERYDLGLQLQTFLDCIFLANGCEIHAVLLNENPFLLLDHKSVQQLELPTFVNYLQLFVNNALEVDEMYFGLTDTHNAAFPLPFPHLFGFVSFVVFDA